MNTGPELQQNSTITDPGTSRYELYHPSATDDNTHVVLQVKQNAKNHAAKELRVRMGGRVD